MKKVLYFFPDIMGLQNAGNITRAMYLLRYFKSRQYEVDFAGIRNEYPDTEQSSDAYTINLLKEKQLADRIYLLPRKPNKKNPLLYFFRYKLWNLIYHAFTFPSKTSIPTFMTLKLKRTFEQLLKNGQYDVIVISYVYYADLVSNKRLTKNARLIIDTHDFITAQYKNRSRFDLGATFADEIKRLNAFDEVWAISAEERYIFNQFSQAPVKLVPMMMNQPPAGNKPAVQRKYDLIYVASHNIHNQRSARWFFQEVYPLLPAGIKICVIGKINEYIGPEYDIVRIPFADNLDAYYTDARVALCPMLSGTGVKVKVVEAMAHGLPIVCTANGADGLPNKVDNGCLVTDDPIVFAQFIQELLTNPLVYEQQQQFATRLFQQYFETGASYRLLDDILPS